MRIPFPERIPTNRVAIFAAVLFAVQQFEGTPLYFSACSVAFVLIAALAFNTAGGLTSTAGVYILSYSLLDVIIGLSYKAYLGEPADSNLLDPHTTILAFLGSITALFATVIVSRRFARRSGVLQTVLKDSGMYRASVGCMAFGAAGGFIISLLGEGGSALRSAFTQLDQLIPLGIIIGVMYEIRRSGGTRSTNPAITFGIVYCFFFYGVLGFSKQGMLLPVVCWALPVCAMRYRLSRLQVVAGLLFVFVVFYYLVPFSQYGRNSNQVESPTFSQNVAYAIQLLEHPNQTRQKYLEATEGDAGGYYNSPQGFWDRLQFISVDDGLINVTDQGMVLGLAPIKEQLLNAVPHILWPSKPPVRYGGNYYMHEINGQPPDEGDTTTGISFSPTAEAYHWAKWVGIFVVAPLIWLPLFVFYDWLIGDIRATPWGLLVLAQLSHIGPEAMLSGLIHFLTFDTEIFVFCALFATWVAPIFAIAVLGPDRRKAPLRTSFQPAPAPRVSQ